MSCKARGGKKNHIQQVGIRTLTPFFLEITLLINLKTDGMITGSSDEEQAYLVFFGNCIWSHTIYPVKASEMR